MTSQPREEAEVGFEEAEVVESDPSDPQILPCTYDRRKQVVRLADPLEVT